jgi:NSS family neurotransmitter:Na+ symporter
MGTVGVVIGLLFFIMVTFAALTSSVSVMEAIVSGIMDKFKFTRKKAAVCVTIYTLVALLAVCLGYNVWYFELKLPNGTTGQILDLMDYVSNYVLMPLVAMLTCLLIGWVVKPKTVIDEVTLNGEKFGRKKMYVVMIKVVAPLLLLALFLQAIGVLNV